jgi:hypothetical protein
MRIPLLAAAAALSLAALPPAPAAAQGEQDFVVQYAVSEAPRAVYLAALEALEGQGYVLRVRSLDEQILTLPRFRSDPPGADELAPQLLVTVEPAGDSTRLTIHGRAVPGRPRELKGADAERALAASLEAQVMASAAIDSLLEHRYAGVDADRREGSTEHGYGRENPVRVGGGAAEGVRRQRRYLDRLRGPAGEPVRYRRLGSCCIFATPTGHEGQGALDAYEVMVEGADRPVVLYLDLYTEPEAPPPAPAGFTLAPGAG